MEKILLSVDSYGKTFLHHAAQEPITKVEKVVKALPRQVAGQLLPMRDNSGSTARDMAKTDLHCDYIDQIGSYPVDFYPLHSPPKVLIFYSTKNRQSLELLDGHRADSLEEKDCLQEYFIQRSIPFQIKKDPTSQEVFSAISSAQDDRTSSGLMVFIMCHGKEGVVEVAGPDEHNHLLLRDVTTHMCRQMQGKPKVNIPIM